MLTLSKKLSLLVWFIALFGYLTLLVFTPIHLTHMANMKMPMEDCPFEMTHQVICSTAIGEHIRTWQSWFEVFTPLAQISLLLISFVVFNVLLSPQLTRLRLYSKRRSWQNTHFSIINLFSQGILHTKAF